MGDNIVYPAFGKPPAAPSEPTAEETDLPVEEVIFTPEMADLAVVDIPYCEANPERFVSAKVRCLYLLLFLNSLKGYVADERKIEEQRRGIAWVSLEELCSYLADSIERDWKLKPSFYEAVCIVFKDRVELITAADDYLQSKREKGEE